MTTEPNSLMAPIHNRMPVILSEQSVERWIEPGAMAESRLAEFITPFPADQLECFRVNSIVNNVRNESPECVMPYHEPTDFFLS